ncbi:MAG: type II toxin-antitoxin system death-on-curing family toxin [Uliginosibacterium sp.]|nr:type II toxin-antitoxin system death-on-curing family toxin [Uliginosibacterium sp.]
MNWQWIDKQALVLLHDESLSLHGGASGIRDPGMLESALARPKNLDHYGAPDIADLASAYAMGLAKNHPFVDGNKRAAFLAVGLFLFLNNHRLIASPSEATLAVLSLAAGEIDDAGFARWLRTRIEPRT